MSTSRVNVSSVRFEINARQASASMEAMQVRAESLNKDIEIVKKNIADLGDVAPDHQGLLDYRKQLDGLNRQLKDVKTTMKDYTRGVKAADQLLKAYEERNIESLSMKAIRAGQNGLKKRIENIRPDTASKEELNAYRIIKEVIAEGDRVMNTFKVDAAETIQILKNGGTVAETTLKHTRDGIKGLMESTREGSKEFREYQKQFEFLTGSLKQLEASSGQKVLGRAFRGDFANADKKTLEEAIAKLREYQGLISDPEGKGARLFTAAEVQIKALTEQLKKATEQQRRLAGEVVTVADAMKVANVASKDEAATRAVVARITHQQAMVEKETATKRAEQNRQKIAYAERELSTLGKQIEEQEKLVKTIEALDKAQDKASDEQSEAFEKRKKIQEEHKKIADEAIVAFNKVRELREQLEKLNQAEPVKPKVDTSEIDALKEKLEKNQRYEQRLASSIDYHPEWGEGEKTVDKEITKVQSLIAEYKKLAATEEEAYNRQKEELALAGKKSGLKKTELDWVQSEKVAIDYYRQVLSQSAAIQSQLKGFDLSKIFESKSVAEFYFKLKEISEQIKKMDSNAVDSKVRDWVEQQLSKVEELKTQYQEAFDKARNLKKHSETYMALSDKAQSVVDYRSDVSREENRLDTLRELKKAQEAIERLQGELKKLTETTNEQNEANKSANDTDKQREEIQKQLTDAEEKLATAKQKAEEASKKLDKAEKDYTAAVEKETKATKELNEAKKDMNLGEQEDKLDALWKKEGKLTDELREQKQAEEELAQAAAKARQEEQEAAVELAQAQNQNQEAYEQALAVLEKAQRKTNEGTPEYDRQATAIEKLKQKLSEMKGEWMSLAEAEKIASKAGTDGFFATAKQMQQATQAIERQRDALIKTIQQKQRDGVATASEEAELKRLEKVLKDLKFEQDNFNMSHKEMDRLLKAPKSAEDLEQLRAAIKRADGELKTMKGSLGANSKEYQNFAKEVKNAKNVLKEMEGQAKANATAFDKAWDRFKTYVTFYVSAAAILQKVMSTMGDMMDLSDKMGEVRKTTGMTADEVGRLSDNLAKMDVRTNIVKLLEISAAAGQLGLKTQEDIQGFTEAANKLMIALPEMGKEAATEMMRVAIATGEVEKIRKQLQEGTIEGSSATAVAMEKIASTIDRLRASSASTAPEITDFIKRVGAVGAQSGISIDQVAALGSTVSSLGMRVEMSATALSRMIPAIRNNAFEIGALIGKTEEDIKRRFATGQAMSVILDIFRAIRERSGITAEGIKEDADGVSDKVEKMMEASGFQDVLKELNQQGARAGIVFTGLSQNVEQLEYQLGVAKEAYEENIAIQQEFDRMNDTTAAKWERLKNQIEEVFVSNSTQRGMGKVIDFLRGVIDLFTGSGGISGILQSTLMYLVLIKIELASMAKGALAAVGNGLRNIGVMLGFVKGQMTAMQWSNIFFALAGAVLWAAKSFGVFSKEASLADKEMAKADKAISDATEKMERLFVKLENASTALSRATETMLQAKDGSKEAAEAQDRLTHATDNFKMAINAINMNYGQYLGFMLTEYDRAELVAAAHDKITASLKREMYQRQQQQSMQAVNDEYNPKIIDEWANTRRELREKGVDSRVISDTFEKMQSILGDTHYDPNTGSYRIDSESWKELAGTLGEETVKTTKNLEDLIAQYMYKHLAGLTNLTAEQLQDITGVQGIRSTEEGNVASRGAENGFVSIASNDFGNNVRKGLGNIYAEFIQKRDEVGDIFRASVGRWANEERNASIKIIDELKHKVETQLTTITTSKDQKAIDKAYQELAQALLGLDNQVKQLDQNIDKAIVESVRDLANKVSQSTSAPKLAEARSLSQSIFRQALANNNNNNGGNVNNNNNDTNNNNNNNNNNRGPYGNYNKRIDPYEQWDANALVNRRKDMLKRVRALANGADVQQVLSMDKKFMDESTRKSIKNMRDAIAWYNEERLKIQEELHNRNLTNTGDWMDPKKGGSKRKPRTPESDSAIAELDRYYLERKELIEESRAKEEMTEAEYNRRLDALEMEHLQKRNELRLTYTSKDKQFIQQFRQWWASVEELDEVSWETIDAEWKAAFERDRKYNNRAAQKDLTQMQAITVKQLHEIEAIIDKERPFNGITRNLQDNLTKMGLLFKDGAPEADEFMKQNAKRMTFLLTESENAYAMTWEKLSEDMRKNGFGSWVDAITGSENSEKEKEAIMAQLRSTYDAIQEAIKKEASLMKKQAEIMWNNILLPGGDGKTTVKDAFEKTIAQLGVDQGRVSRANSLIGAGQASDRVADKLAIKQMRLQLTMQEHYYNLMRKQGQQRVDDLNRQVKLAEEANDLEKAKQLRLDAQHAAMSLNLAMTKEETELAKQREEIIARTEESQARLYKELKEWSSLFATSMQSLFEASHAGDAEYYNELAKLNLTGKGGPGAGTYIIIDHSGTEDATAHYEYLDEREALERQREIENQNAVAEAWEKVWDEFNQKINDTITDQMNAMLQNASVDANTTALGANTQALYDMINAMGGGVDRDKMSDNLIDGATTNPTIERIGYEAEEQVNQDNSNNGTLSSVFLDPNNAGILWEQTATAAEASAERQVAAIDKVKVALDDQFQKQKQGSKDTNRQMQQGTQSAFAKMVQSANLYGIAYQAMSNDNLDATQKFQMMALQTAGQVAIGMLTTNMLQTDAQSKVELPGILGKAASQLGPIAGPIAFAAMSALLGGLMGMAMSKVGKAKSQISQVTGASVSAGRLATGMLTYAEGNVNEFTDPASLTVGRSYNVDGADGKTYRAKYTGSNPRTHITNGPEFHLVGEAGREAIIDAHTTRLMQMDDTGIWNAIQTLYNGGSISMVRRRRGRGVPAFADGNLDEFAGYSESSEYSDYSDASDLSSLQASIDRQSDLLEDLRTNGIKATFDVYGKGGLIDSYDTGKKTVKSHGERY